MVDGVWNLVLACKTCNRGTAASSTSPIKALLQRLYERNEYLIGNNHPLPETPIMQTGGDEPARRAVPA